MFDSKILEAVYLGNTVKDYLVSLGIFIGIVVLVKVVIFFVVKKLEKFAKTTATDIDDFIIGVIETVVLPFLYLSALYVSAKALTLHPYLDKGVNIFEMGLGVFFTCKFITMTMGYGLGKFFAKNKDNADLERSLGGMRAAITVLVYGAAIIFFLDNMGFKVSTIIAGLGVGGVAVALAAQMIFKDLFGYFAIVLDSPFKIGDFIIVGDYMGTVEYIGVKTTRIRSLSGELIVFSNADLTDSRVRNYKLMEKRRVLFRLGVTYNTKTEKLKSIPEMIETLIRNIPDTVFDRAHFAAFADSSLTFEVVYYVMGADYNKYMDIQQKINIGIKEQFEKSGIEFAFPTTTVYLNR